MYWRPLRSTLFPYTTLFRSHIVDGDRAVRQHFQGFSLEDEPGLSWVAARLAGAEVTQKPEQRLRSEEHTSELQSPVHLVCRLLLEKKKKYFSFNHNNHLQLN